MKKIMEITNADGLKQYRTACMCGSSNCDLSITIERDNDILSMMFHKRLTASSYFEANNWVMEKIKRIKMCFKLLWSGYIDTEAEFIFENYKHVKDFTEILEYEAEGYRR